MTAVYLDTSAFVKIVAPEPESLALRRYLAAALEMVGDLGAFVSYDRRMLEAAALIGIPTETPR